MNRVLKHDKNEFKIIEIDLEKEFLIKSKKNNCEIKLLDEHLIKKVIADNFQKNYKKIISSIVDDDDSNSEKVLTQIESYVIYIKNKFGKYLTEKEINKYLKMLSLVYQNVESRLEKYTEEKSFKR